MKEVKFRGWDKELDFMISIEKYKINLYGQIFFDNDDKYLYNQSDKIVLMQYTGLKDKNGVEIYGGDIVKDSSNRLMKVEWDNRLGTSRFIFKTINKVGHMRLGRFINTHEWITLDDNDIEVIGNIYENKELLA